MAYCTECGTRLPDAAKFCPSCGTSLAAAENESRIEPEEVTRHPAAQQIEEKADDLRDYAGLGRRFVAHLIDLIFVFIIFYIVGMQVANQTGGVTDDGFALEGTPALVTMGLTFVFSLLYFMLTEGRTGQSFGKMVMGIKVVSLDGTPCSMRQAFTRNFLRIIDGLFFYLVGIILILRSTHKQRLGDRVGETVVIRKVKQPAKGSYVYRTSEKLEATSKDEGKLKFRSSWGVKKGKDAWDV